MTKSAPSEPEMWAVFWRSKNRLDGKQSYMLWENRLPVLRRTRRQAREWIEDNYGYIRDRADLRAEPHGWKMPIPKRVRIVRAES